jgi:hypothetical protein
VSEFWLPELPPQLDMTRIADATSSNALNGAVRPSNIFLK